MQKRYTVQHLAERFQNTEKTIRRWIDEGRDIIDPFTNEQFIPGKDPGGNWLFIVKIIVPPHAPEDEVRHPIPLRPRRRVISNGIK